MVHHKVVTKLLANKAAIDSEALRVKKVVEAIATPLDVNQAQVFEDAQVLRYSRGRHTQLAGQAPHAQGAAWLLLGQERHQPQPGLIPERFEETGQLSDSIHFD